MAGGNEHAKRDNWRYVVVIAKAAFLFIQLGFVKSLGFLVPALVFQLNSDYATVGFLVSLYNATCFSGCPLASFLMLKFNKRLVCTLGGLLGALSLIFTSFTRSPTGIGCLLFLTGLFSSSLFQSSYVILWQYFGEQFGVANTASQLGGMWGGVVLPFLTAKLLAAYGLSGALLCLGAVTLNCVPVGLSFRPPRQPNHSINGERVTLLNNEADVDAVQNCNGAFHNQGNRKFHEDGSVQRSNRSCQEWLNSILTWLNLRALKDEPQFTLILLPCQVLFDISQMGWLFFIVSYAVSQGMEESAAVFLPVAGSVGGFVSRLGVSLALYFHPQWGLQLYAVNVAISTISLFIYPVYSTPTHLLICSFTCGCGFYGGVSSYYAVIPTIVSKDNYSRITAVSFFFLGLGVLVSGFLTGYLYEVTQSFPTVFRILGGIMLTVFALVSVNFCSRLFRQNNEESL